MSKPSSFRNIPPPPGSKAGGNYQRFIPREELGDFASWQPGTFGEMPGAAQAHPAQQTAEPEAGAAEWQVRVDAARQAGYQDGYRDGMAALESFKAGFAQQATAQIGALLDAFDQQLSGIDAEVAAQLAEVSVQLARQVLRSELAVRPEIVAQVASEAVNAVLMSARHINVQVHPLDLPLVAEGAEEALKARNARLMANATIQRGGVLVQSDVGAIDARIAVRWAQAAKALGSGSPLTNGVDDSSGSPLTDGVNDSSGSPLTNGVNDSSDLPLHGADDR